MYREEHREIITRESVAQNLKKNLAGMNISFIIILAVAIIIPLCLPFPVMIIHGIIGYIIAVSIVVVLVMAATVYFIVSSLQISRRIDRGLFKISEDILVSVKTQTRIEHNHRRHHEIHEYVFEFESGRNFTVKTSEKDGTRLEFSGNHSNKGDIFYVVTLDEAPDNIVLAYSGVIFKYRD